MVNWSVQSSSSKSMLGSKYRDRMKGMTSYYTAVVLRTGGWGRLSRSAAVPLRAFTTWVKEVDRA